MSVELIEAKTAAETVANIRVFGANVPCTLIASGLAGAETIPINISTVDADTYEAVFQGGSQTLLDDTDNVVILDKPGIYQIVKGVTAGAVGVYIASDMHR